MLSDVFSSQYFIHFVFTGESLPQAVLRWGVGYCHQMINLFHYFSAVFISYNNGPKHNILNTISCVLSIGNCLIGICLKLTSFDLNIPPDVVCCC